MVDLGSRSAKDSIRQGSRTAFGGSCDAERSAKASVILSIGSDFVGTYARRCSQRDTSPPSAKVDRQSMT